MILVPIRIRAMGTNPYVSRHAEHSMRAAHSSEGAIESPITPDLVPGISPTGIDRGQGFPPRHGPSCKILKGRKRCLRKKTLYSAK